MRFHYLIVHLNPTAEAQEDLTYKFSTGIVHRAVD